MEYFSSPYLNFIDKDLWTKFNGFYLLPVTHLIEVHLPWGVPEGGAGDGGCILTQQDFVTGYSTSLRLPIWVAYKLRGEVCDF